MIRDPLSIKEYLAVFPDASFKIYDSLESALISKPLFVAKSNIHSSNSTWEDPDRKKYSFKIVGEDGKPYQINCDGWRILSIFKWFLWEDHTEIKIVAPDGEIKTVDTSHRCSLESIAELLTFINTFSGYKDWSYYELQQENLRLTKENQSLKTELEELRENDD